MVSVQYSTFDEDKSTNKTMKVMMKTTKKVAQILRGNHYKQFDEPHDSIFERKMAQMKKSYNKMSKTDLLL